MENLSPQEFKQLHAAEELKAVEFSVEEKTADPSLETAKVFEYIDGYDRKMNPVKKIIRLEPIEVLQSQRDATQRDLDALDYKISLWKN